jgi:hypothetical protein
VTFPLTMDRVLPTRTVCTAVDDDATDKYTMENFAEFEVTSNHLSLSLLIIGLARGFPAFMRFDRGRKDELESIRSLVEECKKKGKFKEIRDLGLPRVPFPAPWCNMKFLFQRSVGQN